MKGFVPGFGNVKIPKIKTKGTRQTSLDGKLVGKQLEKTVVGKVIPLPDTNPASTTKKSKRSPENTSKTKDKKQKHGHKENSSKSINKSGAVTPMKKSKQAYSALADSNTTHKKVCDQALEADNTIPNSNKTIPSWKPPQATSSDSSDEEERECRSLTSSPVLNVTWLASPPAHGLCANRTFDNNKGSNGTNSKEDLDYIVKQLTGAHMAPDGAQEKKEQDQNTNTLSQYNSILLTQQSNSNDNSNESSKSKEVDPPLTPLAARYFLENPHKLSQSPTTYRVRKRSSHPTISSDSEATTSTTIGPFNSKMKARSTSMKFSDRQQEIRQLFQSLVSPSVSLSSSKGEAKPPLLNRPPPFPLLKKTEASDGEAFENLSSKQHDARKSGDPGIHENTNILSKDPIECPNKYNNTSSNSTVQKAGVDLGVEPDQKATNQTEDKNSTVEKEVYDVELDDDDFELDNEGLDELDEMLTAIETNTQKEQRLAAPFEADKANSKVSAQNRHESTEKLSASKNDASDLTKEAQVSTPEQRIEDNDDDILDILDDLEGDSLGDLSQESQGPQEPDSNGKSNKNDNDNTSSNADEKSSGHNWKYKFYKRFAVYHVTTSSAYQCDDEMKSLRRQKLVQLITCDETENGRAGEGEYFEVALRDDWYHTCIESRNIVNIVGLPLGQLNIKSTDPVAIKKAELAALRSLPQPFVIDNNSDSLLILHPDTLVTSTHLAEASSCLRRAVLRTLINEYLLQTEGKSRLMTSAVTGHLTHELFQNLLEKNTWDDATIRENIKTLVEQNIDSLWEVDITEAETMQELWECSQMLKEWATIYVHSKPIPGAHFETHRNYNLGSMSGNIPIQNALAVHKVLDSEEFVWSPRFGLKGKIDITFQGRIGVPSNQTFLDNNLESKRYSTKVYPLELKTGKTTRNRGHRAQLVLYTLLLSDRYNIDITAGFLYYSKTNEIVNVPAIKDELRALILMRNDLARHLNYQNKELVTSNGVGTESSSGADSESGYSVDRESSRSYSERLPEMIKSEFDCKYCPLITGCVVYHAAVENGNLESSGMPEAMWKSQIGDLTPKQLDFFQHWIKLIDLEERDMTRFRAELWTMGSEEREANTGRCLSNMVIKNDEIIDSGTYYKSNRYQVRFVKADSALNVLPSTSNKRKSPDDEAPVLHGVEDRINNEKVIWGKQLNVGDTVIVSSEFGHYMFASGFVLDIQPHSILLSIDRPLRGIPKPCSGFNPIDNQDYVSLMEVRSKVKSMDLMNSGGNDEETILLDPSSTQYRQQQREESGKQAAATFRIDKDELMTGMSTIRTNVLRLMAPNGDFKRKRLIVDLKQPLFIHDSSQTIEALSQNQKLTSKLNANQKDVVQKVLAAQDYALVLGMPGTGKTTTIATLVRILVSQGKSVLITSYTHAAIDNILLKLADTEVKNRIIRLGNRDKVHNSIKKYLPSEAGLKTVRQTDEYFMGKAIVATTCLGIRHAVFDKRKFDYCIVDEATQITLPVCLGPLRCAEVFVLVGDHYQLPPLVRNTSAKNGGLVESLFKYLCEAHPGVIVTLEYQYRMTRDIQSIPNHIIYSNKLKCGNTKVANGKIKYSKSISETLGSEEWLTMPRSYTGKRERWLENALDPDRSVVFLDTDLVPGEETRGGSENIYNEIEIDIVSQITAALLHLGVSASQIGVISPFKGQLQRIEGKFKEIMLIPNSIEVHTIDRFQGRDKEAIILSWVKSNDQKGVGRLLRDWRRINVAITRARTKLIMVGSFSTLVSAPALKDMLSFIENKGWVTKLPGRAHRIYQIPNQTLTQTNDTDNLPEEPISKSQKKSTATVNTISPSVICSTHSIIGNVISSTE
ncbi:DNA replication endonuclease-helicase Dna2 [Mycoemilia scoparia]|uniref:DNA helicase n=1 Tax=Mycoemilia scoparia TaxID=417184 RepID=A0A9W8A577_9FUNG|nr:DNA replication endonuclease-helicase Dna2 [Mycoemilia scoparia]